MNKHTGFSNISCIYKIISPTGRIYVGKSKRLTERMSAYRTLSDKIKKQKILYRSLKKYGFDAHTVEIVEVLSDYSKAVEKEIYYIKLFNSFSGDSKKGMNLTRGGEGPLGRKMSEKTKRILKEIHTGKKVSQETRERMSASRKGKSSWNKGIQHSDGAKQKMSTAKLGRKLSEEHIQNLAKAHFKKVDIYDNKNVLIKTCCSVIETATFIEGHTCYVSLCLKGKKKNYKKYTFAYHE